MQVADTSVEASGERWEETATLIPEFVHTVLAKSLKGKS